MKKVSLVLGMVLVAGMAMAQNKAKVDQVGTSNGATVAQTGVLNDATAKQFGNTNGALVKQIGTSNIGVSDQLNGNRNNSSVDQYGNTNEAYLVQGMIPGYYGSDVNTSAMVSNNNIGSIKQNGVKEVGELLQVGNENNGAIDQKGGDNNTANVYQGWAGDWWGQSTYTALYSYKSTAGIAQIGSNNAGAIWQYGGTNNYASISETGDGNTARISQGFIYDDFDYSFSSPVINTKDNTASITQAGNGNAAKLFQLGNTNSFALTQNGYGNSVGVAIGDLEVARNGYFEQDGNANTFIGTQNNGATLENTSRQTGNGNYINMVQGAGDIAEIIQDGNLNGVLLTQMGGVQDATILQTGNSNSATVTQSGF